MKRIVIIGVTGAGKTTLAFNIAARLGVPYTDMDELYWRPGWKSAPKEEFLEAVKKATEGDSWVITGNYKDARDILWSRADTLIWLDYSFATALYRLGKRTIKNVFNETAVCNGNKETLSNVFSRSGIIPWFFQTYGPRKREYGAIFDDPASWPNLKKIRLHDQKETDAFVAQLSPKKP